jgi:ribonuclease BN (tRNA processing enzyme)
VKYSLVVNGLDNAYMREFGCGCARCSRPYHVANTSVSLLVQDGRGMLQNHFLFDAGSGVTESLLNNPVLQESPRLDAVLLTHWHFDHTCELQKLGVTLKRSRKRQGLRHLSLPVWCRQGVIGWLKRQYPTLEGLELKYFGSYEPKGTLLSELMLGLGGLEMSPISIAHYSADLHHQTGEALPCCCGYLLKTPVAKAALLWDLDATNLWLMEPNHPTVLGLRGIDHLFIDCDTWALTANPDGRPHSHASFWLVQRIARNLKPKNTWLVHLSGHGDHPNAGFGWDDERWQEEAQQVWQGEALPGKVRVPRIGEVIGI